MRNGGAHKFHYHRALDRLEALEAWQDIARLPRDMLKARAPPGSVRTCATRVLRMLGRAKRTDLAMGMIDWLEAENLEPDVAHYTMAVHACGADWRKAFEVRT